METWHGSKYGQQLRFCNEKTLAKVRKIWDNYHITPPPVNDNKDDHDKDDEAATHIADAHSPEGCAKSAVDRAMSKRAYFTEGCAIDLDLTAVRSAAPVRANVFSKMGRLHTFFWYHGTTGQMGADIPNPTVATGDQATTIHYGMDPVLGFHVATAHTPLAEESPLEWQFKPEADAMFNMVEAARAEFRSWAKALREFPSQDCILRFVIGDALAVSYAIQQKRFALDAAKDQPTGFCTDSCHVEPMVMDGQDYTSSLAPVSFNVIETTTLSDKLGAMNVIAATAPLLNLSHAASLYTESKVRRDESFADFTDTFLNGHLPTMCTLMGLYPVEYWTNSSSVSSMDDMTLDDLAGIEVVKQTHIPIRLTWKQNALGPTQFNPPLPIQNYECAKLLHGTYLKMFQHENVGHQSSTQAIPTFSSNSSMIRYHRGSFALFLRFVRSRVVVNWTDVMYHLINFIENDYNLLHGPHYAQELELALHIFKVKCFDAMSCSYLRNCLRTAGIGKGLRTWKSVPLVVCVTVKVPRERVALLTDPTKSFSAPLVQCIIQSSGKVDGIGWQHTFSGLQLSFGDLSTSGERSSDAFKVQVSEDEAGWSGNSALIVSFLVPPWTLLREPDDAIVTFGIQPTPSATKAFLKDLDPELAVFKTTLGDEESVFITRYLPNHAGNFSLCPLPAPDVQAQATTIQPSATVIPTNAVTNSSNRVSRTVISTNFDENTCKITSLTGCHGPLPAEVMSAMNNGCKVSSIHTSPCMFKVTFQTSTTEYDVYLGFPTPVISEGKKSSLIGPRFDTVKIEAPLARATDWKRFPSFIYPTVLEHDTPVVWNMTYVNLDRLPIIDVSKHRALDWVTQHVEGMFTEAERKLREQVAPISEDRMSFKSLLNQMFYLFIGFQAQRSWIFVVQNPSNGGIQMIFFVSSLKLDLASRTVVLDAAVLPLTDTLREQLGPILDTLPQLSLLNVEVDDIQVQFWKLCLPSMVERARRTWEHVPDCEYLEASRVPLSTKPGQPVLCSCGNGKLPDNFITGHLPQWGVLSKYCVRAALSPCFPAPFAEHLHNFNNLRPGEVLTWPPPPPEGTAPAPPEACQTCGMRRRQMREGVKAPLLVCPRCRRTKYCSSECQATDWHEHKETCNQTF